MKNIIFILTILFSLSGFAQDIIPVKTDGTKYYLEVYDGVTNKKVLQYEARAAWQYAIFTGDFFDGSDKQLWSFEATAMYPGYFSIVNQKLTNTYHLMSYSWFAYFTNASNRDPKTDKEMQYKFVKVTGDYYKLITIEKPTDGSLYGINYTPGPDALNVDKTGQADFEEIKSSVITPNNMVNMVFKIVEFNPVALFEESIVRGDKLFNENTGASEKARYDLFYTLEKAREIRVFGTDAEMLAFQKNIDKSMADFNSFLSLNEAVKSAKTFIEGSTVGTDVKTSFNAIVAQIEEFVKSSKLDYNAIAGYKAKLAEAQNLVTSIVNSETYRATLTDAGLNSGMLASINAAKAVIANITSDATAYTGSIAQLAKTKELSDEIIIAQNLIAATQEFADAKVILNQAITKAIAAANTSGSTVATLDVALKEMQAAIAAFKRALEAGDTVVNLENPGFESGFTKWVTVTNVTGVPYTENKGVDKSKSMTVWKGSAYQFMISQSIGGLPNGKYQVITMGQVSADNSIALFAKSGSNVTELPLLKETGGLIKRVLEIEVSDGMLQFGVKGTGVDNAIPAGNWGVFDAFEVKWMSKHTILNPGFENGLTDWTKNTTPANAAYPENKGVDKSKSITCWAGSAYNVSISQTLTGLKNGTYAVSAMTNSPADNLFSIYGKSGGVVSATSIPLSSGLVKNKVVVNVTDGTLEFGIKGNGENNGVPAGKWIVFDNFEVVRLPDLGLINPGFEDGFNGWKSVATTGVPYLENKGVDKSKSVTFWKGSNYNAVTSQSVSGIANGSYELSAMTNVSAADVFDLFGQSAGNVSKLTLAATTALVKNKVTVSVTDSSLEFGIKGSGEGNAIPAGKWIVFDSFELKLKTITPEYIEVKNALTSEMVTGLSPIEDKFTLKWWQTDNVVHVNASEVMSSMSVYSITGAKVLDIKPNSTQVSFPSSKGIYLLRVKSGYNTESIQKIVVR